MEGVAIYARKSAESDDRQALSISSQLEELQRLARQEQLQVQHVFTEQQSAKAPGRPVFNHLCNLIEKGRVDSILCWKLDRLARNPVDGGRLIWALEQRHLTRIVTPNGSYGNTSNDKFWVQLEFGMAKKYVDDLSENVWRGIRSKLARGWLPGCPPLGYRNDRNQRTIIADPERFHLMRRLWERMLTGHYSVRELLNLATHEWRLRTRLTRKIGGTPVSLSGLHRIFHSPFYAGSIRYAGEEYPGQHPAMITRRQFDAVQLLLRRGRTKGPSRLSFAFTGLWWCGCGITAERKCSRYGHYYVYYRCTEHARTIVCAEPCIEVRVVEAQVERFLRSLTLPASMLTWP